MKNSLLIAVASLLASASTIAVAAVVDDFERGDSGFTSSPSVTMALVDSAEGSRTGKALSMAWPSPHKLWVERDYTAPRPIPGLEREGAVAIHLQMWMPASPSIIQVGLHLVDAQHEIFLWNAKVSPSSTSGWREVVVPIDVEKPAGHWGGHSGRIQYPLKLAGYAVVFANDKVPAGRVLIDQVEAVPLPRATLETDRFPSLVNARGEARCELRIANPEDHPVEVAMKGSLTGFFGPAGEVSGAVTVPAGGEARLPLNLADRTPGIRWLDYTLRFEGMEVNSKTSFVIADPVERSRGANDFRFGVASHIEKWPAPEQEMEAQALAASGATVMRTDMTWAHLERKPGEWRWESFDKRIDLLGRYGIEAQVILGFPPSHAVPPELQAAQTQAYKNHDPDAWKISLFGPPEDAAWRRYVAAAVKHYQGKIRLYEVWNEPDLGFWRGTTDQYIQALRSAADEVHRGDPQALLMTGGFATLLEHQGRAKNPDLQERVLTEASDAFDIHAFHQHGPFDEFKRVVEGELSRVRAEMKHPRPLYFNETAIWSSFIGEKAQAITLVKKLAYAMAQGAVGYTWYDLRNDGTNPANMEHNYGLLTENFRPKAAFAAYMEAVRRLQGMRHLGNLDLGPQRQAHVFGSDRGRVLVWWNEGRSAGTIPVLLRCGKGPVRVVDMMGAARELPQVDGVVLAQPEAEPQYVEMPAGQGMPALLGTLVRLDLPRETSTEPLKTTLEVVNPLNRTISLTLAAKDGSLQEKPMTLSLPPGGKQTVAVTAPAPARQALVRRVNLDYAVAGTPWTGVARYASEVVRVLENKPPSGREPDWVLQDLRDVVSQVQADPALAALNWRGPDDLSARIWLWREHQSLRLRVDVRDDTHVQKEKPAEMLWRGDSIQFGLRVPGVEGCWELGAAQGEGGQTVQAVWTTPPAAPALDNLFTAVCESIPGGLRYDLTLPCDRFRLTDEALANGIGVNLIVNDNDGNLRESFLRLAPGLGDSKDPRLFPTVRLPNH